MAELKRRESEVAAHLNDAARLNLLNPGDANALNDVIMDYFTSRDPRDDEGSDYNEFTEQEESDEGKLAMLFLM